MPLIRYGTDDFAEMDENGNILSIIGRTTDFLYNKKGERIPCISSIRSVSMANIINFQYYQPRIGVLIYRVVVTKNFGENDIKCLLEDFNNSFYGLIDCSVEVVESIPKTKRGKQLCLVQDVKII